MELMEGGCNVYALFAVNAPIIRMVSSCMVAVTVFLMELHHLYILVNHTRLYNFETIISSELK